MTPNEILEAAKEAGLYMTSPERIAAVESLVAIIERKTIERCAVVAAIGPTEEDWTDDSDYDVGMMMGHRNAAAAISKLGEQ